MSRPKKWNRGTVLAEIRKLEQLHGGTFSSEFIPQYLYRKIIEFFGSWRNAYFEATGKKAKMSFHSDEELMAIARKCHSGLNGFLTLEEFLKLSGLKNPNFDKKFGSYYAFLEKAIGSSPPFPVLNTIMKLNERADGASVHEIREELRRKRVHLKDFMLRAALRMLLADGLIARTNLDRMTLWSPTEKGRAFVEARKGAEVA